jgi:mono/diheme cytochrome c family protein
VNLKESFNKAFSLRNLFLWGNVILLAVFLAVLGKDQVRGWKYYQTEFKKREIARVEAKVNAASTPEAKGAAMDELRVAKRMPIEIRQLWSQDLNAVDRCISCHMGYDPLANSSLTTDYKEHPYSASSASPAFDIHKAHNLEKFGCVVCHGGQGIATEVKAAHGEVEHWERPLLRGTLVQSSCIKCHDNHADLKINGQVYTAEIVRAKKLFKDYGCIGCHQIGGEGGPVSVDLREETSAKPLSRIDFSHSGLDREAWTLANWIKIHFTMDPMIFNPGDPKAEFNTEPIAPSAMPPFLMPEKDADALTAYILGLDRKGVPPQYLVAKAPESEPVPASPVAKGRLVYEKYGCAACHGPEARGGIRNYNAQYDVTPNLRRVVATYTRDEIKEKISEGVPFIAKHDPKGPQPPLYMPPWKSKIKGEELENLVTYLQSVKE